MLRYGFKKALDTPFDEVQALVVEELQVEGFGVLTQIDLQVKFKEKLGIEFPRYVILGACNPTYAHKALLAEPDIGLMLPCNIIVYENNGQTVVSIIKPSFMTELSDNSDLKSIAPEVEHKLQRVFNNLS